MCPKGFSCISFSIVLTWSIWLGCLAAAAQSPSEDATEDWLLQQVNDANQELPEAIMEEWQQLAESASARKINLNRADRQALMESGKLFSHEIEALLAHRSEFGLLLDWFELQAIPGFTVARIQELALWFEVLPGHQRGSWRQSFNKLQHRWLFRIQQTLEEQSGYTTERRASGRSHYLGPQHAFRSQYRQSGQMHQAVISISRDAGELGIDQLGGHLALQSNGRWKRTVFGDFHIRLGEGLVANTLFGNGRSVWIDQFVFNGSQLRGASGLQNFGAYRGVSGTFQINKKWHWMPWLFSMRWSGSFIGAASDSEALGSIGTLRENGLHRTPTEFAQRHQIPAQGFGSQLFFNNRRLQLSLHGQFLQLPGSINRNEMLHQQLWPVGPHWLHAGIAHRWQRHKWHSQGEVAWQWQGGMAALQQLYFIPHSKVQMRIAGRWYSPKYLSYHANSLHRGSRVNNEQGLLLQLHYQHNRHLQIALMSDWAHFPWMRFQIPTPSNLREERLAIRYDFSKTSFLVFQVRIETQDIGNNETGLRLLNEQRLVRAQWRYRQQLSEGWDVQWWLNHHWSQSNKGANQAQALALQLRYKSDKWAFAGQISTFDATTYENRFFQPEPDVLYGMGMSSLYGQGARLIAMAQYQNRFVRVWLRYARTAYSDRQTVGAGLDESQGNIRSQISIQCQLQIR